MKDWYEIAKHAFFDAIVNMFDKTKQTMPRGYCILLSICGYILFGVSNICVSYAKKLPAVCEDYLQIYKLSKLMSFFLHVS